MKDCENLMLYASGELEAQNKAAFEQHLQTCAACRAELALLRRTEEALADAHSEMRQVHTRFRAAMGPAGGSGSASAGSRIYDAEAEEN